MPLPLSLYVPRLRSIYIETLRRIREQYPDRILMLCVRGPQDAVAELRAMGYPIIDSFDGCCATLAALAKLRTALKKPALIAPSAGRPAPLPPDALRHEFGAKRALAAAGIPVLPERLVQDADAAVRAAAEIGFPVVLKIASPDLPHKTEVGGVKIGLSSVDEVRQAFAEMLRSVAVKAPHAAIDGVLVAPMAKGVAELILGTTTDPVFGPVVMVGLGGIFAEIIGDVAVQTAPVTEAMAMEMLRSLKAFAVLDGARGRPHADTAAAARAIAALSRFAAAHARTISEIDINPLLLMPEGQGVVALDALLVSHSEGKGKES
jgi:hypothetical protein